ncbi:MAG: helix-turn-helix domain-containing protein [Candidatus Marinimicrobia bacterium]|nr:helix-turn-helix domain-containing protein [Candidatus Neomarinimicrobiota bacterium]
MEKMFTKKEAAELLKVSERTIDRLSEKLGVAVYQVGRQLRYPESSVMGMLTKKQLSSCEHDKILHALIGG